MLVGLFRILLLFLLIYYGIKFVTWLIQMPGSKNSNSYFRSNREKKHFRKEGDVKVDFAPKRNKIIDKNSGEYIDYEEVKDD